MTIAQRGDAVLSGVQTHATRLNVVRGEGPYLVTDEGRKILDFAGGIAVASTGHCHPNVVAAIQAQSAKLIHACSGVVYYEPHIALAEKLRVCLGWDDAQFFFGQSGSEAVEGALKLAKYVSKKSRILSFKGGFHGRTLGAASITASKQDGYHPLLPNVDFIDYPYAHHGQLTDRIIDELTAYFAEKNDDLAAVIIEPVLGEGGYVPAPKSVLVALRKLCDQYGVYLIFDEIQSGMGRTGNWFAFHGYGVEPDIVTIAKGVASGMPLGAVAAREALMSKWTTGAHGGTYSGNPVCAAAANATVDVIAEVLPGISALSQKAYAFLKARLANVPKVGDIRVAGLMIGVEFGTDDAASLKQVLATCLDQDLLLVSCGVNGNVVRIMPPLVIDEATLMAGLTTFCDAIDALN